MVSIAEPINYRIFERKRHLEEGTSGPTPSMPWSQCRTKTKQRKNFSLNSLFQADSVLERIIYIYIYIYVYIFSRCGGFNPKIVLASVSAIWSKKLLSRKFLSGYYFKIFDTQNFFWEILSQENHFWSLQKTKNKTKATVLAFFLFFFPRIFFSSILFYEIILLFLVHWPEHGRTTRLT